MVGSGREMGLAPGCHRPATQSPGGALGDIPAAGKHRESHREMGSSTSVPSLKNHPDSSVVGFQKSPGEGNDHGLREESIDFILSLISSSPFPGMFSAEVLFKTVLIRFPSAAAVLLIGNWGYLTGFT